jgi:hypothetical protein
MDLGTTFAIPVDWQFLPLATQIEELQNIVEDLQQTQLRRRPTPADGKMRQDKLLKQCETQLRGNCLSMAASSHSDAPQNWFLPDAVAAAENLALQRLSGRFDDPEKPATS